MMASISMNRIAVAVRAAEVLGVIALVIATFMIAFANMALAWRVLAVFMAIEGGNRLSNDVLRLIEMSVKF